MKSLYSIALLFLILATLTCGCGDKPQCQPSRKYLVVTTFAGLANRLRILASAKIMAALTDRHLVIDWPIIPNELPARWDELFLNPLTMYEDSSLEREGCSLETIKSADGDDPIIKNLGTQNDPEGYKRLGKITEDKEPIVYVATSLNFKPDEKYLSAQDYHEKYRMFYQNLDPYQSVATEIKQFQKDNNFSDKYMIGVHYRSWSTGTPDLTQGVTTDAEHRYVNDFIKEMEKAAIKPLNETDNKPVAFFLASDDPKIKQKFSSPLLAHRIFTRDVKVDRTTLAGQQSAVVDFYLMGETNYVIGTFQSSFSDEAAHLSKQDKKINIGATAYQQPSSGSTGGSR